MIKDGDILLSINGVRCAGLAIPNVRCNSNSPRFHLLGSWSFVDMDYTETLKLLKIVSTGKHTLHFKKKEKGVPVLGCNVCVMWDWKIVILLLHTYHIHSMPEAIDEINLALDIREAKRLIHEMKVMSHFSSSSFVHFFKGTTDCMCRHDQKTDLIHIFRNGFMSRRTPSTTWYASLHDLLVCLLSRSSSFFVSWCYAMLTFVKRCWDTWFVIAENTWQHFTFTGWGYFEVVKYNHPFAFKIYLFSYFQKRRIQAHSWWQHLSMLIRQGKLFFTPCRSRTSHKRKKKNKERKWLTLLHMAWTHKFPFFRHKLPFIYLTLFMFVSKWQYTGQLSTHHGPIATKRGQVTLLSTSEARALLCGKKQTAVSFHLNIVDSYSAVYLGVMDADAMGIKFTIHDHRIVNTKSHNRYGRFLLSLRRCVGANNPTKSTSATEIVTT